VLDGTEVLIATSKAGAGPLLIAWIEKVTVSPGPGRLIEPSGAVIVPGVVVVIARSADKFT
jgi:hypothetical protein